MPELYKTTFNYLLTHRVIPHLFFKNLDFFYETVLTCPESMQSFMQNAVQTAIDIAKNNPDIEPGEPINDFPMKVFGDSIEEGVISVLIPNCNTDCDCAIIAFPCVRESARYFTCELSSNPLTDETFFITGEWTLNDEGYNHSNYGKIDVSNTENFPMKIVEIVYGGK
jgi:hypothetical protein